MTKIKEIPTATAKISILYVNPTLLASSVCPHCKELNFTQIYAGQENKSILTPCAVCEEDFYIKLPDLPKTK